MVKQETVKKIKEVFENTVESGDLKHSGSLLDIDYFGMFGKAAHKDKIYKINGIDTGMFNYVHDGHDSVLIVFFVPINTESASTKHIADRVMEITELMEKSFITVDYMSSNELKDDKFIYLTIVKRLPVKGDE